MATIQMTLRSLSWPYTFNMLNTYIRTAGLEYTLQGGHPLTFFAPSDEVFRLHARSPYDMLKNVEVLRTLIQYHIVPLKLSSTDLKAYAVSHSGPMRTHATSDGPLTEEMKVLELPTVLNTSLTLTVSAADMLSVQGVQVVKSDLEADNGVIHVIDGILWPPGISEESFGVRNTSHYAQQIPGQEARA